MENYQRKAYVSPARPVEVTATDLAKNSGAVELDDGANNYSSA